MSAQTGGRHGQAPLPELQKTAHGDDGPYGQNRDAVREMRQGRSHEIQHGEMGEQSFSTSDRNQFVVKEL
jgi:hypothetical protein